MKNLDFIYNRKSIRKFKDIEVQEEDIIKMLDAAIHAPSPKNQQTWHFVVIQNNELINKIADIVTKNHINLAEMAKEEKQRKLMMNLLSYYTCFRNAPVFDYDVSAKIKTAIVSYLMIKELCIVRFTEEGQLNDADIVDISHMYSKDIEHLEENIESLAEIFETNDVFSVEEMLITLMN